MLPMNWVRFLVVAAWKSIREKFTIEIGFVVRKDFIFLLLLSVYEYLFWADIFDMDGKVMKFHFFARIERKLCSLKLLMEIPRSA